MSITDADIAFAQELFWQVKTVPGSARIRRGSWTADALFDPAQRRA